MTEFYKFGRLNKMKLILTGSVLDRHSFDRYVLYYEGINISYTVVLKKIGTTIRYVIIDRKSKFTRIILEIALYYLPSGNSPTTCIYCS